MHVDSPSDPNDRLPALDILRGIAVLGILVMNIQSFAMPDMAYVNPRAWGDLHGLNGLVFQLSHVLASGKFISIFSILFGAGIALQTRRGLRASAHFRRMAVLFVIGLAHAYLLWHGDILVTYAVIGSIVFAFRSWSPRALLASAAGAYACGILLNLLMTAAMLVGAAHGDAGELRAEFQPSLEVLQREVVTFRGSWLEQMPLRASYALYVQTFVFLIYSLPYVGGLMLLGMALTKLGFFEEEWPVRRLARIAIIGCILGWAISASQLWFDARSGHDPILTVVAWPTINALAMPLVAVGYAAGVCWIVIKLGNAAALRPLAAIGRTALSCYLLETILCTTLFYGHGLGWFGSVDRVGQMGVVVAVWIVLLIVAPLWLRVFPQGPMEWLWRKLAYGSDSLARYAGRGDTEGHRIT